MQNPKAAMTAAPIQTPPKPPRLGEEILRVKDVCRGFNKTQGELLVLDDANLSLREGEIVGLLGRSGSGKSTLLRIIAGLIEPTDGEVTYMSSGDSDSTATVPLQITLSKPAAGTAITIPFGTSLAEADRQLILATLEQCGGVKTRAAEILGISLKTLYNRLVEYGNDARDDGEPTDESRALGGADA